MCVVYLITLHFPGTNDFTVLNGATVQDMQDGARLRSDFFMAHCKAADGAVYKNLHSGVHHKPEFHNRFVPVEGRCLTERNHHTNQSVFLSHGQVGDGSTALTAFWPNVRASRVLVKPGSTERSKCPFAFSGVVGENSEAFSPQPTQRRT